MATTARAIITQALTAIGAYSNGEELQPADSDLSLIWLINQLDAFAADRLWLNVQSTISYTLPPGTTQRSIGTGGDIDTPRPVYITGINYVIPNSSPPVETPMGRMDDDSYMNKSIKTLASSLPTEFYYNQTFPLGTLNFWPAVTQNVAIKIYAPQQSISATTLDSTVQGPPGYMEALIFQLALRLCMPFGKQPPALLPEVASQALARAKRQNVEPGLLGVDAALVPTGGGGYNILNDTTTAGGNR